MFDAMVPQVLTPKQKFAAIVQEGLAVQLSAQAGMSKEIFEVIVTYLSRRHELARQESARIAEETPEIKAMGKPGQAPLMSVFYMNSAKALREMARETMSSMAGVHSSCSCDGGGNCRPSVMASA